MMRGLNAVYRRSDNALLGALAIMAVGIASSFAVHPSHHPYTKHAALVPVPTTRPVVEIVPPKLRTSLDDLVVKTSLDVECLAEVLYFEARGEGVAGEKAVAEVVLQRTRDRNYPHTICGVVHDSVTANNRTSCQFSFVCDGSIHRRKNAWAWHQVRRLATRILSGATQLGDVTGHAIAFHSVGMVPSWAGSMLVTAQIGNHIFYKRDSAAHARLLAVQAQSGADDGGDSGSAADAGDTDTAAQTPPDAAPEQSDADSEKVQSQVQTASAVGNGT